MESPTASQIAALGWSLVPVPHGKKHPVAPWAHAQNVAPSLEQVAAYPEGFAVVLGEVSGGLICLDFDDKIQERQWLRRNLEVARKAVAVARTSRGAHYFFRTAERPGNAKFDGGDLLAEGKLAVLPPTRHPSGEVRAWIDPPREGAPIVAVSELGIPEAQVWGRGIVPVGDPMAVHPGARHATLLKDAIKFVREGLRGNALRDSLRLDNERWCDPMLPRQEVDAMAKWAETHLVARRTAEEVEAEESPLEFAAVDELLAENPDDYRWLVEGFLPRGHLVLLGGTSKAGKTCFVTALAAALLRGERFLGAPAGECRAVLWLAYEESPSERAAAIRLMGADAPGLFVSRRTAPIDDESVLESLRAKIRETGAGLVVVDPLYGAHRQESLSDGQSARRALGGLKRLCGEEDVAAIVIHHINKNVGAGMVRERMADSAQLLAVASMDVLMDARPSESGSGREIVLKCRGRGEFANRERCLVSPRMGMYEERAEGCAASGSVEARVLEALEEGGPMTASAIAEATALPLSSVRNLVTLLHRQERLEEVGTEGRARVFGIVAPDSRRS